MSSILRLCGALALSVLAASCAPLPPPGAPPAPRATGAPAPAAEPEPEPFRLDREPAFEVAIGLDLDTLTMTAPGEPRLTLTGPSGERAAGSLAGPLRARAEPGSWTIVTGRDGSDLQPLTAADTLWVGDEGAFGAARGSTGVRWQNKTWRGRSKLFLSPRGKLTLVTRVPLETYMIGVVPGEIGGLAPDLLEAGRAQAIAARSYTLFYRGRRATEGFDLYGTVEDQVYGPIEGERPLATRCVETTRGEIALALERPIRANYYSTCGGISADVWEAWPADPLPYLISHRDASGGRDFCAQSPHYRWKEEWTPAEFLSNLATHGPPEGIAVPERGMGELREVRVASRSRSGRAWRLVVETSTGTLEVPAYALRRVLRRGGNPRQILRSNLIKIAVRRDPRTRAAAAVVASGAGSGHGVGLCQTGAIGMARSGIAARDIVLHYYPGSSIEKMY